MVQKRTCSFCGGDIEPGTGKMFVRKDGTVLFFCRMKCEKNFLKLGRIPRRVQWTEVYAKAKHGAAVEEKEVEAEKAAPTVEGEVAEVSEVMPEFTILAPKGKEIPQAVVDLIDKRMGPELSASSIEKHFADFTVSETLRHTLALWYRKRYAGKKLTEVSSPEYAAFLETSQGKKILKDWLDEIAKKEKEGK